MLEQDILRMRIEQKAHNGDISDLGTIRTDDKGLVAYLSLKGFTPTALYTKSESPKWIYFLTEVGDEDKAHALVSCYYGGKDKVDAFTYSEWLDTAFDLISTFKRQYPEGGKWIRKQSNQAEQTNTKENSLKVYLTNDMG